MLLHGILSEGLFPYRGYAEPRSPLRPFPVASPSLSLSRCSVTILLLLSRSGSYFDNDPGIHRARSPESIRKFSPFPFPVPFPRSILSSSLNLVFCEMRLHFRGMNRDSWSSRRVSDKTIPGGLRLDLSNCYGARRKSDRDKMIADESPYGQSTL